MFYRYADCCDTIQNIHLNITYLQAYPSLELYVQLSARAQSILSIQRGWLNCHHVEAWIS